MNEPKTSFREIEHTADLGIEVKATDLPGLFASAGEALYALIADTSTVATKETIAVSATGNGWEELLHDWLSELLAQFNLRNFLGKKCEIKELDANHVESQVKGEILDLKRHRFNTEIKGVTYHHLKVWQDDGSWHAQVIFDV
jgi:SHS2 domain-containing protein